MFSWWFFNYSWFLGVCLLGVGGLLEVFAICRGR